jgi:hypothetical protein
VILRRIFVSSVRVNFGDVAEIFGEKRKWMVEMKRDKYLAYGKVKSAQEVMRQIEELKKEVLNEKTADEVLSVED